MKRLILGFLATALSFSVFAADKGSGDDIKFDIQKIQVGTVPVTAEIAETPQQASRGLMFRHQLKDGDGMLFIFHNMQTRSFWMKNTFIPLSIGFFDDKKTLIDIQDMAPVKSEMQTDLPIYNSKGPAAYALEVPQGWFKKHKVKVGEKLTLK